MPAPRKPSTTEAAVIPLVEERLHVEKREVVTGRVRIHIKNDLHDVRIAEELVRGNVDIERIRVDRQVDSVPDVRDVGDTIIIPVVEEILVVEKRLMLREEIHIRRRARVETHEETVSLIRQRAVVERVDVDRADRAAPLTPATSTSKET